MFGGGGLRGGGGECFLGGGECLLGGGGRFFGGGGLRCGGGGLRLDGGGCFLAAGGGECFFFGGGGRRLCAGGGGRCLVASRALEAPFATSWSARSPAAAMARSAPGSLTSSGTLCSPSSASTRACSCACRTRESPFPRSRRSLLLCEDAIWARTGKWHVGRYWGLPASAARLRQRYPLDATAHLETGCNDQY